MANHPNRGNAAFIRRTYNAFRVGARLTSHDVERLLAIRGVVLTTNELRELGRDSDRSLGITPAQLYELVSAWADEQRGSIAASS